METIEVTTRLDRERLKAALMRNCQLNDKFFPYRYHLAVGCVVLGSILAYIALSRGDTHTASFAVSLAGLALIIAVFSSRSSSGPVSK